MLRRSLPAAVLALGLAAPAQAATTLNAARTADRDCSARFVGDRASVDATTFRAPREGTLRARLNGTGDWDLAAYDAKNVMIAGSKAFRSNELVEVHLRKGATVKLQACRVAGRSRSVRLTTSFSPFDFETLEDPQLSLVEVPISAPWQVRALETLGFDVTHDVHDNRVELLVWGKQELAKLARTGLGFEVKVDDVVRADRLQARRDADAARNGRRSALPTGRTTYRTFEDVQQELKDMVAQHPDLVRPFTLKTKTFQGRDIQAIEVARNVASEDDTRPVVYLNGIHHAREWPATEVLMEFVWDVLKNNKTEPKFAEILDKVRIVFQPYTNVDGFIVSRGAPQPVEEDSFEGGLYSTATGVVLLGGSFSYKRKNCNPYPATNPGPCELTTGTDNNRNYPHKWGGGGASTNPNDQSFRGSGPGSEPETKAVQELQLSLNAPVLISMHNIAAKVLRPPGTEAEGFAPDEAHLLELGRRMAEPTGYANERGFQLYDVTGGTKDWAYAVTGAAGYTVETGPADGDFHGAYESVVVAQYEGEGDLAGRGMREALINASLYTIEPGWVSRIQGRAPAGRTLRIVKDTITQTSNVCAVAGLIPLSTTTSTPDECIQPGDIIDVPEKIEFTTKIPASGRFDWFVNPSTKPYGTAPEAYTLTCEDGGKVIETKTVTVKRGDIVALGDLPCGGTIPTDKGSAGGVPATVPGTLPATGTLAISFAADKGKRSTARTRGMRVRVSCTVQCNATASARIDKKVARALGLGRKAMTIGTGKATIVKSGRIPFFIKLNKKAKKALAKKRVKKFSLKVAIAVTDTSGKQMKRGVKTVTLR